MLIKLKGIGTTLIYLWPTDSKPHELIAIASPDASKGSEHRQLGVLVGLRTGEVKSNAIYRAISWFLHKSRSKVKSVPAAEAIAAAESIDEAKMIAHAYNQVLGVRVHVQFCVDSKDLLISLSTQRNSIDQSTRCDVVCIRKQLEKGNVDKITWWPVSLNMADDLRKPDSPLTDVPELTLYTARLQLDSVMLLCLRQQKSNLDKNGGVSIQSRCVTLVMSHLPVIVSIFEVCSRLIPTIVFFDNLQHILSHGNCVISFGMSALVVLDCSQSRVVRQRLFSNGLLVALYCSVKNCFLKWCLVTSKV